MSITNYNLRNQLRNTLSNIRKDVQAGSAASVENTANDQKANSVKTITYKAFFDFNKAGNAAVIKEETGAGTIKDDSTKKPQ